MDQKKIIPDVPASLGAANALRRARQLAELRWTPVGEMPELMLDKENGESRFHRLFFPAWRPQTGANYSAVRFDEKYIGFNVSIETYMTALTDPNSVLYTRSLHGKAPLSAAWYGTVCSEFVSYVMDLPFHIDCQQWTSLAGMEIIDPEPLENLRLCDTLVEPQRHLAVITGIDRDEDGRIVNITVTESTPPCVTSAVFSPKAFVEFWLKDGFLVVRNHRLDRVTYTPNPWVPLAGDPETAQPVANPSLMPDYGDRANYLRGERVTLDLLDPACTAVELTAPDGSKTLLPAQSRAISLLPEKVGVYRAAAVCEGTVSAPVEFCVVDASVTLEKREYAENEAICPQFSCAAADPQVGWVVKTAGFAKVWGYPIADDGTIPPAAKLPEGSYLIIALYRNRFGVYASQPCFFEVRKQEP